MQLTPEQMRTLEDALEYSCNALSVEFEAHKDSREATDIQRAVESYGRMRRYSKLLKDLRTVPSTPAKANKNNVVVMMAR